jgi:hypothetical protein
MGDISGKSRQRKDAALCLVAWSCLAPSICRIREPSVGPKEEESMKQAILLLLLTAAAISLAGCVVETGRPGWRGG